MAAAKIRILSALVFSSMVASCSGGIEGELLNGIFSDSPVAGLSYATPSASGITDADGLFNYREGETVVFSIGKLALPVVVASDMVTPLDMAASESVTDPSVVNIARLLQSLDEDSDPDNGITIPADAADSFTETSIFDAADDGAVDDIILQLYGTERQAVSADQAVAHFVDSLSADSGSTPVLNQLQYIVPIGAAFEGESLYVDEQNFTLSVAGESHTGTTTVKNGVYQLAGNEDHWFVSVYEGVTFTLACVAKAPQAVYDCNGDVYRVFDEEQAAWNFSNTQDYTRAEVEADSEVTSGLVIGAGTDVVDAEVENSQPVAVVDQAPASTEELTLEELFPDCAAGTADDDGDGFGWQNNQSCLIVVDGVVIAEQTNTTSTESEVVAEEVPAAPSEEIAVSEIVEVPEVAEVPQEEEVTAEIEPVDTTEVIAIEQEPEEALVEEPVPEEPVVTSPVEEATPAAEEVPTPVVSVPAQDITDIIVLTGQANASAIQTDYDAALDTGNERLFAFTEDGQWRAADLNQYWDENLPSNFSSVAEGRDPYNNLAFQIGKSLTEQTDRVVGIIMITASGEGISHWDYNSAFYQQIRNKVNAALDQLPQKTSVDAMIWMQGETDWLAQGSADPGATGFTSTDSDFYRNYYPNKLTQLIGNLRSEAWYGFDAQFICGETKKTDVNQHLMALNNDGDDLTSCAAASDLPTRDSDPFGNHFSAEGLRILGGRIAELYQAGDQ